ncbi:MAG: hypothetical protein HYS25_09600 [Ignavibacteriales bacterium]|nr:hypothetical protein [Ignavibacteriales bacterium]
MELTFVKLCEVTFSHNYYKDEEIKDVVVQPTSECSRVLYNQNIFFRKTKKGFILLCRADAAAATEPFIPLDKKIKLTFHIYFGNPHFLNFTDLPVDLQSDEIFYLSNLNNNVNGTELLLSSDTSSGYVSSNDKISLRPQKFTYSGSSSNSSVDVVIKNVDDNIIHSESADVLNGKYQTWIDLTSYPPSRYKLNIDGTEALDFYADSLLAGKKVFGLMEIFINEGEANSYSLVDSNKNISAKKYLVKFNRRKTVWKYYVVTKNRTSITSADLEINHPDSTIVFSASAGQELSDGSTAIPFVSNKEIDLAEEAVTGIELKTINGSGSNSITIENLPNPSIKNSVPDTSANKVYSEIFVYI